MLQNRVSATGVTVCVGEGGWYEVTAWHRLEGALSATIDEFTRLSWEEAVDVMVAMSNAHRPGWAAGDGWSQPPLFA